MLVLAGTLASDREGSSAKMSLTIVSTPGGVRFASKVVPGASRDRVVGLLGDALKIAVSKPPSGGAANAAVIALLATKLEVSPRDISIVSGHGSPRKLIDVRGMSPQQLEARLRR